MARKSKFGIITLSTGIILMLVSLVIFMFANNGFPGEVHSEIFGAGFAIFMIGLVFMIFKIKVG